MAVLSRAPMRSPAITMAKSHPPTVFQGWVVQRRRIPAMDTCFNICISPALPLQSRFFSPRNRLAQMSHALRDIAAIRVGILRKSRAQEQTADRGAEEPYEQAGAMHRAREHRHSRRDCRKTTRYRFLLILGKTLQPCSGIFPYLCKSRDR